MRYYEDSRHSFCANINGMIKYKYVMMLKKELYNGKS